VLKGQKAELGGKTPYQKWVDSQGIPVLKEFYVKDLGTVELEPWAWKGGLGAYLNLIGTGESNDSYICEIPPGKSLNAQRYLFEEMIYVVGGRGATSVWNEEGDKSTFEWGPGSVFSPPINTWRQHFNGSGSEPARLFAVTSAPLVINLFHNLDFIFDNDFSFTDRAGLHAVGSTPDAVFGFQLILTSTTGTPPFSFEARVIFRRRSHI